MTDEMELIVVSGEVPISESAEFFQKLTTMPLIDLCLIKIKRNTRYGVCQFVFSFDKDKLTKTAFMYQFKDGPLREWSKYFIR